MKKIQLVIILIILIVVLAGCSGGSYIITRGSLDAFNNGISGHYNSFTGEYFKKEKFSKDEVINFHIKDITEKGQLTAKLIDSNNNVIAEFNGDKSVKIKKTDTYKVQVEGLKHKGTFSLTWDNTK